MAAQHYDVLEAVRQRVFGYTIIRDRSVIAPVVSKFGFTVNERFPALPEDTKSIPAGSRQSSDDHVGHGISKVNVHSHDS